MARARILGLVVALLLTGCGSDDSGHATAPQPTGVPASVSVSSAAFDEGGPIPTTYTCRGDGTSPPLEWSGVPPDTGSLALVVDDPDAPGGGYVHWVVIGIPAGTDSVAAGSSPAGGKPLDGSGGPGWRPPCPPSGTHHYRFTVYVIPSTTGFAVSDDAPLPDVLATIAGAATAWGRLTGTVTASGGDAGGGY
jgi:Raf kinase inhibitor-like YbhB/YbcL family protein